MQLFNADCLDVLPTLEANSVDTIITDPPYGLEFMGKDWDRGVPGERFWTEALRVAKPGAILLAFGGTRTHHRLMCAIEDAGWEIRDCMMWLYGSGFPKSKAIDKAIDKRGGVSAEFEAFRDAVKGAMKRNKVSRAQLQNALGNFMLSHYLTAGSQPAVPTWGDYLIIRDTVGLGNEWDVHFAPAAEREVTGYNSRKAGWFTAQDGHNITAPATPLAAQWHGWGTALKPAWEPIIVAQKPLDGTYAANAERWGVAGMWIDGGRIAMQDDDNKGGRTPLQPPNGKPSYLGFKNRAPSDETVGRWPANLILDEESAAALDVMSGERKVGGATKGSANRNLAYGHGAIPTAYHGNGEGGASRFFKVIPTEEPTRALYCAKASRRERNYGLEGMEKKEGPETGRRHVPAPGRKTARGAPRENHHPTVKPLALMRYLCRLTKTPTGGVVLDMFAGSGTTGMAALLEGREFIGIEADTEHGYFEIMRRRIEAVQRDIEAEQSKPRQYALNEAAS